MRFAFCVHGGVFAFWKSYGSPTRWSCISNDDGEIKRVLSTGTYLCTDFIKAENPVWYNKRYEEKRVRFSSAAEAVGKNTSPDRAVFINIGVVDPIPNTLCAMAKKKGGKKKRR